VEECVFGGMTRVSNGKKQERPRQEDSPGGW
jgi:hypothetical protein